MHQIFIAGGIRDGFEIFVISAFLRGRVVLDFDGIGAASVQTDGKSEATASIFIY